MPRPLLPCRQPGCGELVAGGGRCREHYRQPFASSQRHPLPRGWARLRARILRRDGYRCVCGEEDAVTVDHIVARAFGGLDTDDNLISLGPRCRRRKDAADAAAGRRRG